MKYFVYIFYKKSTGQVYVGQTQDLERRLKQHKYNGKDFKSDDFVFLELHECLTRKEALQLEAISIKKYDSFNNGLNKSLGCYINEKPTRTKDVGLSRKKKVRDRCDTYKIELNKNRLEEKLRLDFSYKTILKKMPVLNAE